jgi:hypothetical protein
LVSSGKADELNLRFTVSVEEMGARDVVADNAEALAEAFERRHPEAGAAVGASLNEGMLEATFSVSALTLGRAARKAHKVFIDSAIDSGLTPSPIKSVEVEIDLGPSPLQRRLRLRRYRRSDGPWRMPKFVHSVF